MEHLAWKLRMFYSMNFNFTSSILLNSQWLIYFESSHSAIITPRRYFDSIRKKKFRKRTQVEHVFNNCVHFNEYLNRWTSLYLIQLDVHSVRASLHIMVTCLCICVCMFHGWPTLRHPQRRMFADIYWKERLLCAAVAARWIIRLPVSLPPFLHPHPHSQSSSLSSKLSHCVIIS